ncbi:hypothetical protein F0P96_04900 [Hymenobacter busanensis]|uniref:Uncharacterized protein n=1 Tax=Hymenobacter busanensis TaxID=2607656 RepID=A0A7L5A263_9BACT|nr:hypothetical protein [Hymenobacter busanensis]KAA9338188.1 hypothetical protein F0P96_04900 [Hymenobacter busanensis]QHJ09387.1 hypothetical protein GUY19_19710 [Hymenobacter busanensis]
MKIVLRSALLVALLGMRTVGFAAADNPINKAISESATQGALTVTLYLTDALHLSQTQTWAVRECTRTELQQLAVASENASTPDAALQAHQQYDAAMQRILTPAQYTHFLQIERTAPMTAAVSRVLASR